MQEVGQTFGGYIFEEVERKGNGNALVGEYVDFFFPIIVSEKLKYVR